MSKKIVLIDADMISTNDLSEKSRFRNSLTLLTLMHMHGRDDDDLEFIIATHDNVTAYSLQLDWTTIGYPELFGNKDISFLKDTVVSWDDAPKDVGIIIGGETRSLHYLETYGIECREQITKSFLANLVRDSEMDPDDISNKMYGASLRILSLDLEPMIEPEMDAIMAQRQLASLYADPDLVFEEVCNHPSVKKLIGVFDGAKPYEEDLPPEFFSHLIEDSLKTIFIEAVRQQHSPEQSNDLNRINAETDVQQRFIHFNIDDAYSKPEGEHYDPEVGHYDVNSKHRAIIDEAFRAIKQIVADEPTLSGP